MARNQGDYERALACHAESLALRRSLGDLNAVGWSLGALARVYRSLGDFEDDGRLARVSFETFQIHLEEVTAEVEPELSRLRPGRLRTEITNALESYRDGAFYWRRIYEPRFVHVSAFTPIERRSPSDAAFMATVPYTVVTYWRQAARYLKRAEEMVGATSSPE